ncbi:MAG: hypothetical protein K8R35_00030 [Bacteroidales bacterium]|nr:hypothetical protein [Bacteroidales bacterium]
MGIPSFFKQNKAREFNFIPRYYDPDRERREERVRRIKLELGIKDEGDEYVPRIQKGSMTNFFRQKTQRVQRYTAIRLIVILLVLILISYVFFYL